MKNIIVVILLFVVITTIAQEKKKVGIFRPYDKESKVETAHKLIIGTSIRAALANNSDYFAIDMGNIDVLIDVVSFGQNGFIKESERKKLGEMYGPDLIMYIEVDADVQYIIISSSLIEIETGNIINGKTCVEISEKNSPAIIDACNKLTKELFPDQSYSENRNWPVGTWISPAGCEWRLFADHKGSFRCIDDGAYINNKVSWNLEGNVLKIERTDNRYDDYNISLVYDKEHDQDTKDKVINYFLKNANPIKKYIFTFSDSGQKILVGSSYSDMVTTTKDNMNVTCTLNKNQKYEGYFIELKSPDTNY